MQHKVLFVDDDELVLRALGRTVSGQSFQAVLLSSSAEALAHLEREPFAAVVTDLAMPEVNGVELLRRVREIAPDTGRIMLSAHGHAEAVLSAVNDGEVQRYLLKPWNDTELRRAVQDAVERYDLRLEVQRLRQGAFDQNERLWRINQGLEEQIVERTVALRTQFAQLEDLQRRLSRTLDEQVRGLVGVLQLFEPRLAVHALRTSRLARALGAAARLKPFELRALELAGLLHRLGLVRRAEVSRPDGADELEGAIDAALLRSYPARGAEVVAHVAELGGVVAIVRAQLERWDGLGTPGGLEAEAIPRPVRVLAVASCFADALQAQEDGGPPAAEALRALQGTVLDPGLVDLLLDVVLARGEVSLEVKGLLTGSHTPAPAPTTAEAIRELLEVRGSSVEEELARELEQLQALYQSHARAS